MSRATLLILLILLVCNGRQHAAHGQLVVTELMMDPRQASAGTMWVEVYNTINETVSLNGWELQMCTGDGTSHGQCRDTVLVTDFVLRPHGYAVVGNHGRVETNGGIPMDLIIPFVPFAPNGSGYNYLALQGPNSSQWRDYMYWNTMAPDAVYLHYPFVPGASLARIDPTASAHDVSNWRPSTRDIHCRMDSDKGTPGFHDNHVACPDHPPQPTRLSCPSHCRIALRGRLRRTVLRWCAHQCQRNSEGVTT